MSKLSEGKHAGCFVVSEANGHLSREQVVIAASQTLKVGHVLAAAANGEYSELDVGASAPLNKAVGVLWDDVTTTSAGTGVGVIIARDAEVRLADLTWPSGISAAQIVTARDELAELDIIVRD